MLSREENELVTRVGQGTPMGNTMRRYWIPALLSQRDRRTRWPARPRPPARRGPGGVPRQRGPHRPDRGVLPASPRLAVFRTQRGMRPALHLSRLEVRRRRRLHRHDERAGGIRLQAQGPHHRLSDLRTGRHRVGVYGPGREDAAAAEIRLDAGAGSQSPCHQGDRGVQLAAGARRRHRYVARADLAPAADRQLEARRDQAIQSVRARQGTEACRRCHRLRLSVCRHPPARWRRGCAHPHLSFRHAVPSDPAVEVGERTGARRRPHLGADG